jgi:HlyD family secretion protein
MADETQQLNPQAQVQDDQTDEDIEAQLAYEQLKRRREAKKRKRILILAIVGAVALVGVIVFIAGQANKDVDQDGASNLVTSAVRRGDFATTVSANGATEPVNSTVVTPEVDGIIEDLRVQEGSTVSEGDVLFTLKNESLDKAIREANTELQTAQRAADKANHVVDEAYAAYNRAVDYGNETDDWSGFDEAALKEAISTAEDAFNTAVDALNAARTKVSEAQT